MPSSCHREGRIDISRNADKSIIRLVLPATYEKTSPGIRDSVRVDRKGGRYRSSDDSLVVDQTLAGESRRYSEAARFVLALENQTEAGKTGIGSTADRISLTSGRSQ